MEVNKFSDKNEFIRKFINLISDKKNIIIFHHINPDGDCLGSQFGLKLWLKKLFPDKNIFTTGDNETLFNFLKWDFDKFDFDDDNLLKNSLAIVVDANYQNRIKNLEILEKISVKVRIDHHPEDDDLDYQIRWVDSNYCAAAEQIADLIFTYDQNSIDKEIASYLYLGIYTDSGRFFYDKTSARTHAITSWLMKTKFDFNQIHQQLAKRTLKDLTLQKEVFNNFKVQDNVIYYFMTLDKRKALDLNLNEANRVDLLANIDQYNIWIFFIENEDHTIRVRLRSNCKNVNQLAKLYGGGGHIFASGAIIENELRIKEVVDQATKL